MRKLYVTIDTGYLNIDIKFPFKVEDDADPDEIRECAHDALENQICWDVVDEDGEEVDLYGD